MSIERTTLPGIGVRHTFTTERALANLLGFPDLVATATMTEPA